MRALERFLLREPGLLGALTAAGANAHEYASIIGMAYEQGASPDDVRQYLMANGVGWTFARADSVRGLITQRFQVKTFPRLMLIDPNGGRMDIPSNAFRGARLATTLDAVLPK